MSRVNFAPADDENYERIAPRPTPISNAPSGHNNPVIEEPDEGAAQPPPARRVRPRHNVRRTIMRSFAANYEIPPEGFHPIVPSNIGNIHNPILLCADIVTDPTQQQINHTKVFSLAHQGMITPNVNYAQVLTHYVAMMLCYLPSMRDALMAALNELHVRPVRLNLPSQAITEDHIIDWEGVPIYDNQKITMIFGCLILCVFKSAKETHYESFMGKRVRALSAVAGLDMGDESLVPIPYRPARHIRLNFGSSPIFKKYLVELILEGELQMSRFGKACGYLVLVLSWNEMHNFNFCYEMFVVTRSPVLLDARVAGEAQHLYEAICAIGKFRYPQFFRYLAPNNQQHVLNRSNFPTLFTAATKLKLSEQRVSSLLNYITGGDENVDQVASQLVELHKNAMRYSQGNMGTRAVVEQLYLDLEPDTEYAF